MKPIQMVDLKTQYARIKSEVDSAIQEVLDTAFFIKGPAVSRFESALSAYTGAKHVIGCANGTDALQIALMALGLKPGDEVLTTSFTYIATAEVIGLLGLKTVLVEVEEDRFTLDPAKLEANITDKTKAIVPVHLFGQCADMEPILAIAKKYGIPVVEDTAQAIGARYRFSDGSEKMAGTMGTIGTTSFFPSKNLGCYGDGGAIFTNDDSLADAIKMIANHGQSRQYYHDLIGVNSRLDSIQAAILDIKLKHLDAYNQARLTLAKRYNSAFSDLLALKTPEIAENTTHVFHQYTLRVSDGKRDALKAALAEVGVPAMIYYPVPVHKQKAYTDSRLPAEGFEITDRLCEEVLSLPMHTEMEDDQFDHIVKNVRAFFGK